MQNILIAVVICMGVVVACLTWIVVTFHRETERHRWAEYRRDMEGIKSQLSAVIYQLQQGNKHWQALMRLRNKENGDK